MTKYISATIILSFLALLLVPVLAFAHQPRIVQEETTQVIDPEISKAYYATLTGSPHTYIIDSETDFDLYVGILLPDIPSADKSTVAQVSQGEEQLVTLGGESTLWKNFFEPFGQSNYLDGGEFKTRAEAGVYTITVSSQNNDSKYSLAVGEIEAFDRVEGTNALAIIPKLKKDFFEESPITFIKSPFGWGLIVVMYLLTGIVGLIFHAILKRFTKHSPRQATHNLGTSDRLLRLAIGVGLLLLAITTTWSPILIFFSGFMLFEAIFSWCGLYTMMSKNTCPVQ